MNLNKMMKQMQDMQANLQKTQADLESKTVTSSVGGDKVTVTATGSGEITNIVIDPSVIDPDDAEFLQELVLKGVQEAIALGKQTAASEMKKVTGGLGNIPGLGL